MPRIDRMAVAFSACMIAWIPAANAASMTLSGNNVKIQFEDKAAAVTGAPSLIATGLIASPASVAGASFDASAAVAGLPTASPVGPERAADARREALQRSFAEVAAMRFSLGDGDAGEGGLHSLLLAGLGLFALIARQRISAMSRSSQLPAIQ